VRRRERRTGVEQLVAMLSGHLSQAGGATTWRDAFESKLRQIVTAKAVHLRDRAGGWNSTPAPARADAVTMEVPGAGAVLEAVFEPGDLRGDWDVQALAIGAHLAALVLELDRSRRDRPRLQSGVPRAKDGAITSLIGSAPAMQVLRDQIERVASTDFTVLLEGASDRK
jgi:transcriptional regulator with AAA-type ATPase domain